MSDIEETGATEPRGISRRTVAKAMAWSVPVIAVAAAAPVAAASNTLVTFAGGGCKLPGNSQDTYKGNVYAVSASNPNNVPVTVQINSITLHGSNLGAFEVINLDTCTVVPNPVTVPAHGVYPNLALLTADAPNSNNGLLVADYTVTIQGNPVTQSVSVSAPAVPPIQGTDCHAFTAAQKLCIETHV